LFALAGVSQPASADQTPLSLDDAKHLLFRTGFGATVGDLNRLTGKIFNESRDREIASLKVWWVRQIIETDSPQTERLA